MYHTFHIPVLGLGYSIDTPLKVARYGVSSVLSIVDDELIERMRKHHSELNSIPYTAISKTDPDSRSGRITSYLDLIGNLVNMQIEQLKMQDFIEGNELCNYFELLPEEGALKIIYRKMQKLKPGVLKLELQSQLKASIKSGSIDVNIMSKVDKVNVIKGKTLGEENTDALAALRGFANSILNSSLIISAGMNPRLFSYMERFSDFYPDENGLCKKKIILKVSDYRSAMIQAKVLAKKGLWVSEFRIESGLNCGGHAFATDGFLLGPILQEFKDNKSHLYAELFQLYTQALITRNLDGNIASLPQQKITVQGGVGTAEEHQFLMMHYNLDKIGWGSPFLLVPEATNVDEQTLRDLVMASEDDFYLSNASPLGIPFNNFKKSSAEKQRIERIRRGRPGSPCTKKYLINNTEFTQEPICTASRQYQNLKIAQLKTMGLTEQELTQQIDTVVEKVCLCEGLCASAYIKDDILKVKENTAVSICPGPNIAYFNGHYSLKQMIGHIYGKYNLLKETGRPNLFIKELELYVDYLKKQYTGLQHDLKKEKYLSKFYQQLQNGVIYYKELINTTDKALQMWNSEQLRRLDQSISNLRNISKLFKSV